MLQTVFVKADWQAPNICPLSWKFIQWICICLTVNNTFNSVLPKYLCWHGEENNQVALLSALPL